MSITENILQLSTVSNWLNAIYFLKNPEVQYSLLLNKKTFGIVLTKQSIANFVYFV